MRLIGIRDGGITAERNADSNADGCGGIERGMEVEWHPYAVSGTAWLNSG